MGFQGNLPFTELYLVVIDGLWPVYAAVSEEHAIETAKVQMRCSEHTRRARIWRVLSMDAEELAVQREVIRESLVPYGTQVDS